MVEADLNWPPFPLKPRIKYIRSIAMPSDIAIKEGKGWLGRAFDYLTGGSLLEGTPISAPYGLFFDSDKKTLYVADRARKGIHLYDLSKGKAETLEAVAGEVFEMPVAVAVSGDRIYVSDSGFKKLLILDLEGNLLKEIDRWERPGGIAISKDEKRLYVVDVLACRIKVFDAEGNFLFDFGSKGEKAGEFNLPSNIWVDASGKIYVTDSMNFRVQIFDESGKHIISIGKLGDSPGYLARPRGVAVDSEGHIYIVDAVFDNVQIFNPDGQLLLFFGGSGRGPGEFYLPSGIFIDEKDRIYISDSYNRRIQVFQYLKEE
ncbi:MAG: 6-bladed beta-propeller [bacterium]|nr:6-bladed beta-propeller [bacterium]